MSPPAAFGPDFGDYGLLGRLGLVLDEIRGCGATRLPPEAELCRRLEVTRSRLHGLLQTLAREGALNQVRGKGWFFPSPKLEIPVARHNSYTANMVEQNKRPRSEVLGIDQVNAEGVWSWVLDFRRYDGDLAFSLARVKVLVALTPGLNLHLGRDVSLYQMLEQRYGIRPGRVRTWCEAVAADPVVAAALEVPVGSPLLKTTHEAHWQGQPFEHTVNFLRADACRVRVDLARVQEETP
jgi:DNA-binding GntR family transcriptional regulator